MGWEGAMQVHRVSVIWIVWGRGAWNGQQQQEQFWKTI